MSAIIFETSRQIAQTTLPPKIDSRNEILNRFRTAIENCKAIYDIKSSTKEDRKAIRQPLKALFKATPITLEEASGLFKALPRKHKVKFIIREYFNTYFTGSREEVLVPFRTAIEKCKAIYDKESSTEKDRKAIRQTLKELFETTPITLEEVSGLFRALPRNHKVKFIFREYYNTCFTGSRNEVLVRFRTAIKNCKAIYDKESSTEIDKDVICQPLEALFKETPITLDEASKLISHLPKHHHVRSVVNRLFPDFNRSKKKTEHSEKKKETSDITKDSIKFFIPNDPEALKMWEVMQREKYFQKLAAAKKAILNPNGHSDSKAQCAR